VKPFETAELQREVREVLRASWGPKASFGISDPSGRVLKDRSTRPLTPSSPPRPAPNEPAPRPASASADDQVDTDVAVLLVESDNRVRSTLVDVLTGAGCRVVAFQSRFQAEVHVRYVGYDVLVARPDVLREAMPWETLLPGGPPLGSIAIAQSAALTERVKSIQEGARGVFVPPFESDKIAGELRSALALMRDQIKRSSVPPAPR